MTKYVITSLRKDAGKTAIAVGFASAINQRIGYMKPFGDRLLYRKKRLWDFDSAVFTNLFGIAELPEEMSIGFDHSKLRYMYDEVSSREKLLEVVQHTAQGKDVLIVETGHDISRGISVHLDALTICKAISGKLIVVVSGDDDQIIDDLIYFKRNINLTGIDIFGVIANKVKDIDNFKSVHLDSLEKAGINLLGVLPYEKELTLCTVKFISDILFARILTAEENLNTTVQEVFVGAMSTNAVLRMEKFKTPGKLIITSGDRSDMLLAAIETESVGIVLTNNILPPLNIIAKADELKIPVLLVQDDTFEAAKKIEKMVPLLSHTDTTKIELIQKMFKESVDLDKLL